MSHIRIFGCTAYAYIPRDERSKFAPKAIKCILVGYCETQRGFRLWDPVNRRVRISRDVKFYEVIPTVITPSPASISSSTSDVPEDIVPFDTKTVCSAEDADSSYEEIQNEDQTVAHPPLLGKHFDDAATFTEVQSEPTIAPQTSSKMNPSAAPYRPLREKLARGKNGKPKVKWADESQTGFYAGLATVDDELTEPSNYKDALESPQSSQPRWKKKLISYPRIEPDLWQNFLLDETSLKTAGSTS